MFGKVSRKNLKLTLRALLMGLVVLALFFGLPSRSFAEEDDTATGSDDVTVTVPLAAPEGEATIVEHTQSGESGNQLDDIDPDEEDRTFENDLPSVTTTTTETLDSGGAVTDTTVTNTLTETGEAVELETATPVTSGNTTVTEEDGTRTTVTVSAANNAIQLAVDKVLSSLTGDSTSATIRVSAGTYDGDISITAGSSVPENFILYILAEDSYETPAEGALIEKTSIGTQSAGTVDVNGNISVDGVNVVLAGLYLSLEKIVSAKNAQVSLYGTSLDDTVGASLEGDASLTVSGGAGNDTLSATGKGGASSDASRGTVTLNGGEGDDLITVDTALAQNASQVTVDGGAGTDRLHLNGTLKRNGTSQASIGVGGVPSISLQDTSEKTIAFLLNATENYTDALKNKNRVEITAAEIADGAYTASQPFVDYALAASDLPASTTSITIQGSGFLSSLLIDGETYTIHNLNASGLNVTLSGKRITVDGTLRGTNILINAKDSDVTLSISADDLGVDPDTIDALPIDETTSADISILDVVSEATVTIAQSASLIAGGSVVISAESSQTHPLIPVLGTGFNMINVKVGTACVTILGSIQAAGNVDVSAKNVVTAEASNASLAKFFVPLAVGVIVADSEVTLGAGASIFAGGSVSMLSQTEVTLKVRSTAGKLPISLAVSVVVSDSHVNVLGSITSQAGSVTLSATGNTTVSTISSNKAPEATSTTSNTGTNSTGGTGGSTASGNTFGGFFAISVVLQNVDASIRGSAVVSAYKDLFVTSSARERVVTKATSADPVAAGVSSGSSQSTSQVLTIIKSLFGKIQSTLTGKSADALSKTGESLNGVDGYAITAGTSEHASIVTPAKVKAGETASVTVTPDTGYILQGLTYTYLPAGQQAYVTKNIDISGASNSYTFVMPEAAVTITAVVRARTASDPDLSTGNLFDEDEDSGSGIGDLFDEGVSGAEGDDETESAANPGSTYTITIAPGLVNGALLTDTPSADAGVQVIVTVNPSANYQLKADTLKATTELEGRTSIQTLCKNAAGQYILTMPAGNVTLSAEFEAAPAGTTPTASTGKTSSSSTQVTGALAVSVSQNKNNAYIDTTGTVTAGGTLKLNAAATTQNTLSADGSPVGTASSATTDPTDPANTGAGAAEADEVTQEQKATMLNGRPIVVSASLNGTVKFVSNNTQEDTAAFQFTARQGYKLAADGLKYSYTNPTTGLVVEGTLTLGSGGSYIVALPTDLPKDVTLTITATFEAERYNITLPASGVTGPASAKKGDKVTLSVTQQEGKTAAVTASGATVTVTDGVYSFVMPGADVTVGVTFTEKQSVIELTDDAKLYFTASDTRANIGDKVQLTLTSAGEASGKKLNIVVKAYNGGMYGEDFTEDDSIIITVTDNSFIVPDTISSYYKLVVSVTAENKAHQVNITQSANGTIAAPAYANGGETITITVTPTAGYKLKLNSLKVKTVETSVEATITVTASANGAYTYKLPVPVGGDTQPMNIVIFGEFIKDPDYTGTTTTAAKKKTFSLGVGIAVSVVTHQNYAYIKDGTITANSLELSAISGSDTDKLIFNADSKAGYSQGDIGVGGAITVQVVSAKTKALIGDNAQVTLGEGGTLTIKSESYETSTTSATAISTGTASRVGVGAGIAVGVIGIDVISKVADGANILVGGSGALTSVDITANHDNTESLKSSAGSKGGVSITPVLALLISGAHVEAALGSSSHLLSASEDITISAKSANARETAANAAAAGGSVGVGASFVITVLNDSSNASLRRSLRARNVKLTATGRSSLKATSRAGSQGVSSRSEESAASGTSTGTGSSSTTSDSEGGEADKQADKGIGGGSKLAAQTGSTNVNSSAVNRLSANRQTAQTSEGNVQVAAAFVLNIQSNHTEASIAGGITVTAFVPVGTPSGTQAGNITVEANSDTDAAIYANASATKAKIGVGVAIALNIVTYDTLAHIDDAGISANSLSILAHMIAESKKTTTTESTSGTPKNIVEQLVEQAITAMVRELADAMGLSSLLDTTTLETTLINLIGDVVGSAVNTLLSGTGLEGLVSTDIEAKITTKLATLGVDLTSAVLKQVSAAILSLVLSKVQETITPGSSSPGTLTFGDQVNKMITNIANEVFAEVIDVNKLKEFFKGDVATQLKTKLTQILKDAGKALTTSALDALSGWLDLPIKEENLGPGHEFITQAIAGAGASEVGIAGSAAIAIITGNTKAYLSDVANRSLYPVVVSGDTEIDAYARQSLDSVASSSVGDDGMADKNLTASGSSDAGNGSSAGSSYESSTSGKFIIGSMQNGKVTVSGSTLSVTPDEGYKLSGTLKAVRSDTGETITLTDNGDGTFTYTAPTGTGALAADATITISALFAEDAKTITVGTVTNGTVAVKDLTKAAATTAKMGDRLLVTVTPATGFVLDHVEYTYTVGSTPTTKQIVTAEDKANGVYTFYMPDANITVNAVFRALAAGETAPATNTNTNSKGKSVGVGASFTLNLAYLTIEAGVGANRSVTSGTLSISADGRHDLETVSVSGTDPLSGTDDTSGGSSGTTTTKAKDIALDASAAVGLVYNTIKATVGSGAKIVTTGLDTVNLDKTVYEDGDPAAEENADYVNFYLGAHYKGSTLTKASGFAVGSSTAVGAAVAVNISYSDVTASFLGEGIINGTARVLSYVFSADDSQAIATAMGADMDRMLGKFRKGVDGVEKTASDITQGNYTSENTPTGNENNQTAGKINGELDKNNDTQTTGGTNTTQANNNLPLSTNAMRSQDTSTTSTPDGATTQANSATSTNTSGLSGTSNQTQASKLQVAAAVAVNITHHEATVEISGQLSAKTIGILADNDGNFQTLGTGVAMSLATKSNSIAVGAAVCVNANKASVSISGELTATAGDIRAEAQLTQNMDGKYKGLLGAQALAGSVTGSSSDMTISGALAIIVSKAETLVTVADNAKLTAENGMVKLSAEDKSKLAVRAGGLSISKGTSVGIGASFALIYARNDVKALVGENVQIKAASFLLRAAKLRVDMSDYESTFDLSLLLTDSSGTTADDSKKGIVDIKKGTGDNAGYSVTINVSTDTVLDAISLLNFLSSNNYYAESIAGAVSGGAGGKASVAGSMAFVFFFNTTVAIVGNGTVIDVSGDAEVTASADTTARLIAGAISASSSKVGVGLTVAAIANSDQVKAEIGNNVTVTADGKYAQNALSNADFMAITIAASVSTTGTGVGGVIDAIVMDNHISSIVGENASISAGSDISVNASAEANLLLVALSVAGSGSQTAVGGTLVVVVTNTETLAQVKTGAHLTSTNGAVGVNAASKDKLIDVLAAASASGGGTSVAATLGVLIALSKTTAQVDAGAVLSGNNDVSVISSGKTWMLVLGKSLSAASQNAVGATIGVCVLQRTIKALVGANAQLTSTGGNVLVQASGENWALMLTLAAAGAGSTALNGTIPVLVGLDTVWSEIGQSAELTAYGSVGVIADLNNHTYVVSGGLAVSGSNAFGATISTVVYTNTVKAIVGQSAVILSGGAGTGLTLPNRASKRRGVFISATANEDMVLISISAAISGSASGTGVINTLVMRNIVHALVQPSANITASGTETYTVSEDGASEDHCSGDVEVEADDDSLIINLAGSLSASGSVGVGATIVVLVFNKTVTADVSALAIINAGGGIRVCANAKDDLFLLAIAFGASGSVGIAGGANALVFQNAVTAALGGTVRAQRDILVSVSTDSLLVNAALAIGGGGTVGVTAIAVITYFYNQTLAYLHTGARVTSVTGDIDVFADSQEIVTADAAGAAIGGTAGVGGTIDIIITKVVTKAYTEASVTLNAGGDVDIEARDTYGLIAVVVTIAGAGVAGVGISVLVSVSFNTIEASIGAGSVVTAGGSITVLASSNRDVLTIVTSVGIGGAAGVGVSLSVVVTGNKLSQDAHDGIYGNQTQKQIEKDSKVYYVYLDQDGAYLYEYRNNGTNTLYRLNGTSMEPTDYTGEKTAVMVNAGMDPQDQTDYAFANANASATDDKPADSMDTLLAGDGQSTSELDPGSSDYGQSDDGSQDAMNDDTYDGTVDNSSVTSSRIGDLSDSTSAVVRASAQLTANNGNISITSSDRLNANMIAGALGGGGYAGVGVGLAVSVLFSNVNALVEGGAVLSAPNGTISVSASAGSQSKTIENINDDTQTVNDKASEQISSATTSTIRLIGVTGGGGLVGVGVTVAVLLVFTEVHAIMAGNVTHAKNVLVHAGIDYGQVITGTLAVTGGAVGVSVSGAVTYFQANVVSSIGGSANLSGVTTGIQVTTGGNTNAIAAAAAIGGGAVAVNAGMALTINRTRVDTFIGQGVTINAPNAAILVETLYTANASAFTISFSAGGVAVGATLAIVVNKLDSYTYIGLTPVGAAVSGSSASVKGSILAASVKVSSNVAGVTTVFGVGVAGGQVAVNGIVALGFNRATGYAALYKANVEATTITVTAILSGDTTVTTTSLVVGGVAVGATVALGQIRSKNIALVDVTGSVLKAGTLNVNAGTSSAPFNSQAIVTVVTGTAGSITVALNFAVSINASENKANICGTSGSISAGSICVYAEGNTRSYAIIANASVGALCVNLSVSIALLKSTQEASLTSSADIDLGGALNVTSKQNTTLQTYSNFLLRITDKLTDTVSGKFSTMAQAYIFSASAGVAVANANIAAATADASGKAIVNASDLNVLGAIGVNSYGTSTASAKVDNITFAFASVGLMTGYAYAAGTFEASLTSSGTITSGSISVYNSFTSNATSDLTPAASGVALSLFTAAVNISLAETKSIGKAFISGTGTITSGAVTVSSRAKATAYSVIRGAVLTVSGFALAVNEAYAKVTASQDAYIEKVLLSASSVDVSSVLNDSTETGAVAEVGSNGSCGVSVKVSYISGEVSLAQALVSARSHAYISGASLAVTGAVSVSTTARSYANADILESQFSLSVYGVTLLSTVSIAEGDFAAYIDTTGATLCTGSLTVNTTYYAVATAAVGAAGGLGVSLVSVTANMAVASNHVSAKSYILGSGALTANGSVNVLTEGYANSTATGRTRAFELKALSIAVNAIVATLSVEQSAYLDINGSLNLTGELNIRSEIYRTGDFGSASATVGGSGAGVDISLIGATVNAAGSFAESINSAYISGSGSIVAGAVSIKAKTVSESRAIARKNFTVGLLTIGSLSAIATTGDTVSATVSGVDLEATSGDITILALGSTTAYALCEQPGGIGLGSGSSSVSQTFIGIIGTEQSVTAGVSGGAKIKASGNVSIRAYNTGSAESIVQKGTTAAVVAVSSSQLPTSSTYSTLVYVIGNSSITAGGSIEIASEDYTAAKSDATGTQIGFGINANSVKGSNTVNVTNTVNILAVLTAGTSLSILATSNANLYARTYADGGGFFSGDKLKAVNSLTRSTTINLYDGSQLCADFGDLLVKASAGANDTIRTLAKITSGGVVALGKAEAKATVTNTASVSVGEGVSIQDRYNSVKLISDASLNNLSSTVEVNTSGLGVRPLAEANTTVNLTSSVTIAGDSASKAVIEGRYVNIESLVGSLYVYSYTYANGKALGADVDADTDMDITIASSVTLSHASVTGHDSTYIAASARPAYRTNNIYGVATARLNAIGEAVANVSIYGSIRSTTTVSGGVSLIGASITVTENEYNDDRTDYKRNTSGFIVKRKTGGNDLSVSGSASIASGTQLHLGDAAGGIHIDISGTEGSYLVRQVGLKNEAQIWTISGETISFRAISNALPGTAYLSATYSALDVYDQSYIPEITIDNRTVLNIVLSGVTVQNVNFLKPIVRNSNGIAVTLTGAITLHTSAVTAPSITITNELDGDLRITGLIANSGGKVSFLWTGETGGALSAVQEVTSISAAINVSPVWANSLLVEHAASIGAASYTVGTTKVEQSFNVYLFNTEPGSSQINATATGDIYLKLTAAELLLLNTEDWAWKPWEGVSASSGAKIDMQMQSIISATGDVVIDLPQGIRAYQLANTSTLSMPVPGTLEYMTDALVSLTANLEIKGLDALSYYLTSYNAAEDVYCFLLPNDTYLYTDALGNVVRISEGGIDFAVSDYEFTTDNTGAVTSITLAEGVTIDLTTGKLTVESGNSYDVLLSVIKGSWLLNNILLSSGSIDLVLSTTTLTKENGLPIYVSEEKVVSLRYFWSYGTQTCYYISGLYPKVDETGTYYLLSYDSASDTFQAYLFAGSSTVDESISNDSLIIGNLLTDDDGAHTVKLSDDRYYYELVASNYHGSVLEEAVSRSTQIYSVDNLSTYQLTYNYNTNKWLYNGQELAIAQINGMYYVPDNYTVADSTLNSVYASLKGKYWTVSRTSEAMSEYNLWSADGYSNYYFAVYIYKQNNKNYYSTNHTQLNQYTLKVNCVTLTPLCLMLSENESKGENAGTTQPNKDYVLTFGSPAANIKLTSSYYIWVEVSPLTYEQREIPVEEVGFAGALLTIQGKISEIPLKLINDIPANNMVSTTTGYRVTETLYVTESGIALMINPDNAINGIAFAAMFNGTAYHSDYLDATHLGKTTEYNELSVDENGNVIYTDENGYIYRLEGETFVYTGTKTGVADITGASALAIIQNGFFLTAVVDGSGNITGYQTGAGVSLTQAEALCVFQLGGTGTFKDASGNIYFFDGGQLLCKQTGVSNISGADTRQWLLDHADYTYPSANGGAYIFSRDLTAREALYLVYGVDAEHPDYTDANGNLYTLVGDNLVYSGAPVTTEITSQSALDALNAKVVGFAIGEKWFLYYIDLLTQKQVLSGEGAAYLLYTLITETDGTTYYKIDSTENKYKLDANGNLIYAGTPLPSGTPASYTETTLPGTATVLETDTEGRAVKMNVGGYIYDVIRTTTVNAGISTTVITYTYSGMMYGVSDISASEMVDQVTTTANRIYDAEDLTKQFAADITGVEALALMYTIVEGTYTDKDGYIYNLISDSLVYSGSKAGIEGTISGADLKAELLSGHDGYYYNGVYFTGLVSEANALKIRYSVSNDIYNSGTDLYRLTGNTLVYTGTIVDLPAADTSAYKALQTLTDGEGNVVGYTHNGVAVSQENALKLFKLLGVGTFKDSDGNLYSFVEGNIVRTEPGVTLDAISGESAVEWLLSHTTGYFYTRDGVSYSFDENLTPEQALRIRYELTQAEDGNWYYTHTNGSVYQLIGDNLVYDSTPVTLPDITSADALITLDGMIVGYTNGTTTVYLETDGTLSNDSAVSLYFTLDG
ncbi:MAG: hypothetical protein ABFD03_07915, partial [Clostridiaceae bacterium]